MSSTQPAVGRLDLGTLLRGEADAIASWIASWTGGRSSQQVLMIVAGAGAFGAAMGCWRDPTQAVFAAIKLPLRGSCITRVQLSPVKFALLIDQRAVPRSSVNSPLRVAT